MTDLVGHKADKNSLLSTGEIQDILDKGLVGKFSYQRVLVLIPDHTRTIPLEMLFKILVSILEDTAKLDFLVALGTHPPLTDDQLCLLVGITQEEREADYKHVGILNHSWDIPETLIQIGEFTQEDVRRIAGDDWHPTLSEAVPVRINRLALDYDHILILGPTFPHEVVGFSGGAKYLFPGISGAEMINATHWLGALAGVRHTIGIEVTPVRQMIHEAAEFLSTPLTLISMVVEGKGLAGIYVGDHIAAWEAAAKLSSERQILWFDKPFNRVLSCAPTMYDELWTAAKAMYKLDPVIADGGEVIIYAPHLDEVSFVHGKYIFEVGYHVLPYFLYQWEKYKHIPHGVLAHSTHVRGGGEYQNGEEIPRISVALASKISKEDCDRLSLGYLDPAKVRFEDWVGRENEGILYVPRAGEMLHRVRRNH